AFMVHRFVASNGGSGSCKLIVSHLYSNLCFRVLLLESKILVISHNIPSRLFQQWEYHQVPTITTQRLDDALQKEPTEKVISECLSLLLRLVSNHLSQCVGNVPEGLDGLLEDIPELIVPLDVIDRLLKCNELLTPAQFLEMYDSPLNIIMDSGTLHQ
uniref:Uncharacterized protein n=1 Tax=Callorhinchus milii TaxID=7868 RepID=A0A4W3JWC5_CALMI